MRRVLTTLMILLVVLVAGLSALVLLVNPNDFRAYMVRQVEARSGYQLKLDGPLRWHVWPQLSILSGRMSLTAPGASQPLVSADNMRLDVALVPLFSHQLQVNQVMLKGAVIQLTQQTEAVRNADAPVAPLDPWMAISAAVFGTESSDREPFQPEQCLDARTALAASTAVGRDRPEPGDPADLVLLDRDPYAVSTPEEMRAMPVAATMLAGRWTYSSLHGE